jgi:MFS superfamily sulfate permease-like transporter
MTGRLWAFLQDTLIVVLLGILIGWWGEVDKKGVEILGEIHSEFPTPIFPPRVLESLKDFQNSIQPSIIIAILGFIGMNIARPF